VLGVALTVALALPVFSSLGAAEALGPEPAVRTLPNGLRVAVFRDPRLPVVQIQMLLPAGTLQEPATGAGLAALTASLLTRGTTSRTGTALAEEVERIGGTLNANATRDYTTVGGAFLARDFEHALDLLGDVVLNPVFPLEDVERRRAEAVSQVIQSRQSVGGLAEDHLWALAFPGHPYGRPVHGTLASLPDLRRAHVQQFHRETYRPDHALLAIAGDVDPEKAFDAVEAQFGSWAGTARLPARAPVAPNTGVRIRIVDVPGLPVAEVRVGHQGPGRGDADYAGLQLASQVLGGSAASSRLHASVRGAQSGWTWQREASLLTLSALARPESAAVVVERFRAELARLAAAAPADSELVSARRILSNGYRLQFDQLASAPAQWLASAYHGLASARPQSQLDAIDRAEAGPAAGRWLGPAGIAVVVVGPASRVRDGLETIGVVEIVEPSAEPAVVALLPTTDTSTPTPEQEAAGRRAIEQAVTAHGGATRLRGIVDSTVEGDMTLHGPKVDVRGTVKQVRREPYQFYSQVEFDQKRTTQVLNGARAWSLAGARGDSVIDEDSLAVGALRAGFRSDPHHVLLMAADPAARVVLRGREAISGRTLDVVEVTAAGDRHVVLLDPESHRLAGVEQNERALLGTTSVRRLYSDYRTTESIVWPHVEERLINGEKAMTLVTRKVDFNSKVKETLFRHPDGEGTGPAWRR